MNAQRILVLALVFVLGAISSSFLVQPTAGQPEAAQQQQGSAGRYMLVAPASNSVVVLDTTTGQIWRYGLPVRIPERTWEDLGKPRFGP